MTQGQPPAGPTLSVVMPVFDGRGHLARSLPAVRRVEDPRLLEVIVVDDGSTDGSAELAAELGARVVPSGGRRLGPGAARNVGVREARGEVVAFVDADVAVHPGALPAIADAFEDAQTVAVFGSYDDRPPCETFASQYMNLRHHFVHQEAADDARTFWGGLGAVRRRAFLDVGGFDPARFPFPSVEDVELGMRLRRAGGRIRRIPQIQGSHLKRWTLREVVRTDVLRRARPWAQLMLEHPGAFTDLNVQARERWKAVLAAALLASAALAAAGVTPIWVPLVLLAAAAWANRALLALFHRRNGAWFALRALCFHQLYYVYSAAVYAWCAMEHRLAARGRVRGRKQLDDL